MIKQKKEMKRKSVVKESVTIQRMRDKRNQKSEQIFLSL